MHVNIRNLLINSSLVDRKVDRHSSHFSKYNCSVVPLNFPTSLVIKISGLSDVTSPCLMNISLRVSYPLITTRVLEPVIRLNTSPYFRRYSWNVSNTVSGFTLRRFPRKGTVGGPGGRTASLVVFFHQIYKIPTTTARKIVQKSNISR